MKAAYRLFATAGVTFAAGAGPHWQRTRQQARGRCLVIGDTADIDFGIQRDIDGLGPTGNGGGWGFLLHSALAVDAATHQVLGLMGQLIHYREPAPGRENTTQRLTRARESEIWGAVIDRVGPAANGVEYVPVLDRGADNFEVFCHRREQRCGWVVRVAQLARTVRDADDRDHNLRDWLAALAVAGTTTRELRSRRGQPLRTATLAVSFGATRMPEPKQKSPYVRRVRPGPIPQSVVGARETDPPAGRAPIEWVLYTSRPVTDRAAALQVLGDYEARWLIEEWHKALKTGCRAEHRQLQTPDRLEAMRGLQSVVAVRLLQFKSVARATPDRPATELVPAAYVEVLCLARRLKSTAPTAANFWRELAKLGGFLGRKRDGEPGWITIWRGWDKLVLLLRGAELVSAAREKYG